MTFYESMSEWLSLTSTQTNLVIISMITTIIQLTIFLFIMKQGKASFLTIGYVFIVFLYNVLYYKIFVQDV